MIKLKDIGNFETAPPLINAIITGNIIDLNIAFNTGWDVNEKIEITEYTALYPISYALIMENFDSVKWLIAHEANLNTKDDPCFLTAVRYCGEEIIRYIVKHGADVNVRTKIGGDAFCQMQWSESVGFRCCV